MKINFFRILLALTFAITASTAMAASAGTDTSAKGFWVGKNTFLLNGKPFTVKAAELHYPRIPRPYWENRIRQCKALGMNTICLYVFWNIHEPVSGTFDFSGQNDLREFVKLCERNGMKVILRPGPYVCAEWEMGGLPWWLLKEKDIRLRENDPRFLKSVDRFQQEVAKQVGDLTVDKGGPIIMVQVENEYGSYGSDKEYVGNIRDMLRRHFGKDVTLFQCDWSSNFLNNGLDDLVWTMNFGTGADIDSQFAELKRVRPDSPLMCSEFWSGWFDKWGANHETRPAADMVAGIDEMLRKGISFSLYMTHGGTNWGHWAGANSPGFSPDVTSYDYDAPITESGQYSPKYFQLRETLAKYSVTPLPSPPKAIPSGTIKQFAMTEVAPLFDNLPMPRRDSVIMSMEQYDQGFGSILYSTSLPSLPDGALLTVEEAHDYAQIFLDGKFLGTLDRRHGERTLSLPPCKAGTRLDILVEAMGRINFGREIKDFKGITEKVTVTERRDGHDFVCDLNGWSVYLLPDDPGFYAAMRFSPTSYLSKDSSGRYPRGVYRGSFKVTKPRDTFLDLSGWGKGLVYVNGHALGRFWEIGPQQTLYLPGCFLKKGNNDIVIFDITGPHSLSLQGLAEPVLDRLNIPAPKRNANKPDLSGAATVAEGSFAPGNGWQRVDFPSPAKGRYLCIEALDAYDGGDVAAIAELYALGEDGKRLSRDKWKVTYADSEDTQGVNRSAEKAFDLQESTFWSSAEGAPFPHMIVIDLGTITTLTGLEHLPRMEHGAPASIRRYRLFLLP